MALKQAELVMKALGTHCPGVTCEIVTIQTSGDWKPQDGEVPLPEDAGGKGQFAKEIEAALLAGAIDMGVHSAKDMPAILPDGLQMEHYLPRSDARDALLCENCTSFSSIEVGAVLGTCSPRRAAIVRHARPDIKIVPLRGNVHTRIRKLCTGQVDVTLLAMAGLERLGLDKGLEHGEHKGSVTPIDAEDMLPACGQGAIGLEIQEGRDDLKEMLARINCTKTQWCVSAEREVIKVLNGSCHTPIAAYAILDGSEMYLRALVASPDGAQMFQEEARDACSSLGDARTIGQKVGEALKSQVPEGVLS